MASTYKAEKKTINGVLNWYLEQPLISFEVYAGFSKKPENGKYSYFGTDKEEGAEYLEKYLHDLKQDGNTNKYSVHLIGGKGSKFTPCMTFQFNDEAPQNVSAYRPDNEILSRLAAIETAMQTRQIEEEEEEEEEPENNFLAGILNDPNMKNILLGVVANFAGSLMPKPKAVAGISETESEVEALQSAIEKLLQKGVTVSDIEKLAAMEQNQISFLLSMLRK